MTQEDLQKLQGDITAASAFLRPLKAEMSRIVSGQHKLIDRLLAALIADGHVLLVFVRMKCQVVFTRDTTLYQKNIRILCSMNNQKIRFGKTLHYRFQE